MNDKEIDIVQSLVNAADKIAEERGELLEVCKLARTAFHTLIDFELLPSLEYNDETLEIIRRLDEVIAKAEGK